MIQDPHKWNLALAKLSAFMTYVREPFREEQVQEFHDIVKLIEEASAENLVHFKIPPEKLRVEVVGAQLITDFSSRPSIPIYSNEKRVDARYFRSQVHALANYLESIRGGSPMENSNPYDVLTDGQIQDLMINRGIKPSRVIDNRGESFSYDRAHAIAQLLKSDRPASAPSVSNTFHIHDSNFVHSSPGASITQSTNINNDELQSVVDALKRFSESPECPPSDRGQLNIDIGTIELQLGAMKPNASIIGTCLQSTRTIVENAVGSALGAAITFQIKSYLGIP